MKYRNISLLTIGILMLGCLFSSPAAAIEAGGIDIHGFVSQGFIISEEYNYLTQNSKQGSFEYNEMGINFSKELTDRFRLGIQFFSRDIGDAANNKVTVDWAYGDYRLKDWLGIRAGRLKLPYGLYNETRDMDMLRTPIVMPQSLYSDLMRDTIIAVNGVGLYGNIDLAALGSMDYQLMGGAINFDNDSGIEKNLNEYGVAQFTDDIDGETTWAASLRWNTPLDGLILGTSALMVDAEANLTIPAAGSAAVTRQSERQYFIISSEYTFENLALAAEYIYLDNHEKNISAVPMLADTGSTKKSTGYYLSASYRFSDLFSLGAYYSVYYPDTDNKDGNVLSSEPGVDDVKSDYWEKDLAVTLRFDINEYVVVKVEGHHVDGTSGVIHRDNLVRTEDEFNYAVAKVTFSF